MGKAQPKMKKKKAFISMLIIRLQGPFSQLIVCSSECTQSVVSRKKSDARTLSLLCVWEALVEEVSVTRTGGAKPISG